MRILFIFTILLGLSGLGMAQTPESVKLKIEFTEVYDKDDEVIGAVVVDQFKDVGGFQFSVQWDTEELEFIEFEELANPLALKAGENFNFQTAPEGHIRTLWLDPAGECITLRTGEIVMAFRFRKKAEEGTFKITDQPISIEFFDCNYQSLEYKFSIPE
jgi:hypothetical protein